MAVNYNDSEMAKYAKAFNSLCARYAVTSFWWDTNFLIKREEHQAFRKVIDAIMECYADKKEIGQPDAARIEGAEAAVHNMKVGWNLGNTLDATRYRCAFDAEKQRWEETLLLTGLGTETCWHMPRTTADMLRFVKELGFHAVRVPVTWIGHLDEKNTVDPEWMARVRAVVDYVLAQGMYCILNVHHDGGASGWVRACETSYAQFSDRLAAIYGQLAESFAGYDGKLLFEGVNEIIDEHASWSDPSPAASFWVDRWNQLFVDSIRSSGGRNRERNLIVMGPAAKSSRVALEQFHMPHDTAEHHLIFEFHNYDPQSFCWPQNKDGSNTGETPFWDDERDSRILEGVFGTLMSFAEKINAPMICGEYAAWPKVIREEG